MFGEYTDSLEMSCLTDKGIVMTYLSNLPQLTIFLLLLTTLSACTNKQPPFLWTTESDEWSTLSEEEEKVYSSLSEWLKQTPFDSLWDPYANTEKGTFVLTNVRVIFPFLDEWYDPYGKVDKYGAFRRSAHVLYNDPLWSGTVLVWGGIKTHNVPFYLSKRNYETMTSLTPGYHSTPDMFGGFSSNSSIKTSSVTFRTTKTFAETPQERQAVLWGYRGMMGEPFLVGFLDRGNLLFLVAFPCHSSQKTDCVKKLGDISRDLSLNVSAWENLNIEDLEEEKHDFFFKAQEYELFQDSDIKVTMNGHPFKLENAANQEDKAIFSYTKDSGRVSVVVHRPQTVTQKELNGDTIQEYLNDLYPKHSRYRIDYKRRYKSSGKIAYIEEEQDVENQTHRVVVHSYLENDQRVKITYTFPAGDEEAKKAAERFVALIDL